MERLRDRLGQLLPRAAYLDTTKDAINEFRVGTDSEDIKGSTKGWSPGLVNVVHALAYHFCLALPAAFTQSGDHLPTCTTFFIKSIPSAGRPCKVGTPLRDGIAQTVSAPDTRPRPHRTPRGRSSRRASYLCSSSSGSLRGRSRMSGGERCRGRSLSFCTSTASRATKCSLHFTPIGRTPTN